MSSSASKTGKHNLDTLRLPKLGGEAWDRRNATLMVAGVGALLLAGFGAMIGHRVDLLFSYLAAYMFVLSIALGGLFFVILHHLAKAGWSTVVRRLAEGLCGLFPLLTVLFIPIGASLFMDHGLFHWAHPDPNDQLLAHKAAFLNIPFFLGRAVFYLAVWNLLARYFCRLSLEQDLDGDKDKSLAMERWAAPAMFLFAVTSTFASVDWLMSLEPHWFSTIFGVYFFAGSVIGVMATLILMASALSRAGFMGDLLRREHYHDLGKLLFAFVVFWAYIAFSQFMLIWYGNLPEETMWFHTRWQGAWQCVSMVLIYGHFVAPFLLLLSVWSKRSRGFACFMAAWMLLVHYCDMVWLVVPQSPRAADMSTFGGAAFMLVGFCCLALAFTLKGMRGKLAVPVGDPRLAESVRYNSCLTVLEKE